MKIPIFQELSTIRGVLHLARRQRAAATLVGFCGLASAVFEAMGLSTLIPLGSLITQGKINTSVPLVGPLIGWMDNWIEITGLHVALMVLTFFALSILVGYVNLVVSNVLAMRFAHDLRVRVFETALAWPVSRIEGLPPGKFVNNLATETWKVCDALFIIIGLAVQLITCFVFLTVLLVLSPFYTCVLIAITLVMAAVVQIATGAVRGLGATGVAANEAFMSYVWDAISGLRVIRGFGRETYERERFRQSSDHVSTVFIRLSILSGVVGPITRILTLAMVGVILGIATIRGDPLPLLLGFLAIAYRMQPRVSAILGSRTGLSALEASVLSVQEALADPGPRPELAERNFDGLQGGIIFEAVSVSYPNAERPALHDIFCSLPYGRVTAIAGYSGAGKSTIVAVLLRFIRPQRGKVMVDGVPLEQIDPARWHEKIAFVEQNAFLFNASVRENIGYGDLDASLESIQEAARLAQAHDFISQLPNGYDTSIGDNGVRLSQGQRQRIALARSLLRKPQLLILDEATNALDRPTERALRAAISSDVGSRAIVVIAHRRETIESADHVIVIDQGRVAQVGTPAELAGQPGLFATLYLEESPLEQKRAQHA
jgi:subfamily B ATP-binding cassette protein MsbA